MSCLQHLQCHYLRAHEGERAETGQQATSPEGHLEVRRALEDVHGIGNRHATRTHGARQQDVGRATTADELTCLGLKQGRAVRVQVCSAQPSPGGTLLAKRGVGSVCICFIVVWVDMHRVISDGALLKGSLCASRGPQSEHSIVNWLSCQTPGQGLCQFGGRPWSTGGGGWVSVSKFRASP